MWLPEPRDLAAAALRRKPPIWQVAGLPFGAGAFKSTKEKSLEYMVRNNSGMDVELELVARHCFYAPAARVLRPSEHEDFLLAS